VGIVDANAAVDAAVGATAPAPAPAPAPTLTTLAEAEPNNTLTAPQPISGSLMLVNASMASATDLDHFRIGIAPGKSVVVTLTPNASADYDLNAYDSAGNVFAQSQLGVGVADSVSLNNSGTAAISVVVRVSYYSGGTGATAGAYTLKLQ
jgi:serine protease